MSNYKLIVKGLQEVIDRERLQVITEQRALKVYWGTAPTGTIHFGYYVPVLKIAQLVQAGCEVIVLIADLHALLDNPRTARSQLADQRSAPSSTGAEPRPDEKQIKNRSDYYTEIIKCMLSQLDVDLEKVQFVLGSSFQTKPEYTMDMYRLNAECSFRDAQHAGAQVVKQTDNPTMTGLLYPSLQALDEQYLDVDAQLGGIDQRKIFMFARQMLPKIGYRKRIYLLTPMVSGLRTTARDLASIDIIADKMSASNSKTKIDLLDSRSQIKKKIGAAYCVPGDVDDNSVLDLLEMVIFPLLTHTKRKFEIFRREEHGGPITFPNFKAVREAYETKELHPADLKAGIVHNLDLFIEPVRKVFASREWQQVLMRGFADDD
jgi:tyrosyl-tRNA synthetase